MIKEIIKLLNSISSIQIIPSYSEKKSPSKPFATYTVISKKSNDFYGASKREYIAETDSYSEKAVYRESATIQFDVYENPEDDFFNAQKLFELIIFILRNEWGYIDVGIEKFSVIQYLREEIQSEYETRATFDVTFEYLNLTDERRVDIAHTIELITNEIKTTIKEGK